ncbi:MAG: hypothetical protein H0W58_14635 [Acidobacteria bacterium]|nr:hypothetical protein [Acidobacteriota bacterium]
MLTTVEAEVDITGKVTLLEPLKITKKSRAILTLLDNNENENQEINEAENQLAEARFARWIGSVDSGNPNSADNELIDADLAWEYGASHDDER